MKQAVTIVAAGLLSWLAPAEAAAQAKLGPWTENKNFPVRYADYYSVISSVSLTADGGVWNLSQTDFGLGIISTAITASANRGNTWRQIGFGASTSTTPGRDGKLALRLFALDSLRAWSIVITYTATGTSNALWYTTTGPAGLKPAPVQLPFTEPIGVFFFDALTGLATGSGNSVGWLYRTTDGGQTWQPAPNLPAGAAKATSGGPTLRGTNAWLLLDTGGLLHTTDRGLTWVLTTPPADFVQLTFRDAQHGLALTPSNTLYRTADGGTSWAAVPLAGVVKWNNLAAVPGSAGTFVAVGKPSPGYDNSSLVASYDDGLTWHSLGGNWSLDNVASSGPDNTWATTSYEPQLGIPAYLSGELLRYSGAPLPTIAARPAPLAEAYPNPTTGLLHLPAAGPYRAATVYDAAGRRCRTAPLGPAETTLDLGGLEAGLYLLRLDGGPAAPGQQRLVVQP